MISPVKDQARVLSTAETLIPIRDNRHIFAVPGFVDVVDIVVYAESDEEALQLAREAIASLTAGRSTNAA